jgi:hypothetical protein
MAIGEDRGTEAPPTFGRRRTSISVLSLVIANFVIVSSFGFRISFEGSEKVVPPTFGSDGVEE